MKFLRIIISHLKSVYSKNVISICLSIIFIYTLVVLRTNNFKGILTIFSNPVNLTIKELTIYIFYRSLIMVIIGNFIYRHIKERGTQYIIRIRNSKVWYLSLLITCFIVVIIIYATTIFWGILIIIISKGFDSVVYFTLEFVLKVLFINLLNGIFMASLIIFLVFLTKKSSMSTLIIIFTQIVSVNITLVFPNIGKMVPFCQDVLWNRAYNYNEFCYSCSILIISTTIIVLISILILKNYTFEILNSKGEC